MALPNILRFLIGLVILLAVIVVVGVFFVFLLPIIAVSLFLILGGSLLFYIFVLLSFIWYLFRNEPKNARKNSEHSKNYSSEQIKSR